MCSSTILDRDGSDPQAVGHGILARRGATGSHDVLTTPILKEAEALCDDILIINDGREVARGDVATIKALWAAHDASLEDVFVEPMRPAGASRERPGGDDLSGGAASRHRRHPHLLGRGLSAGLHAGVWVRHVVRPRREFAGSGTGFNEFFLAGVLGMASFGIASNTAWSLFMDRDNGIFYECSLSR